MPIINPSGKGNFQFFGNLLIFGLPKIPQINPLPMCREGAWAELAAGVTSVEVIRSKPRGIYYNYGKIKSVCAD